MKFSLAAMVRRVGKTRRKLIKFRTIETTPAMARDLARLYLQVVMAWNEGLRTRVLPAYTEAVAAIRDAAMRDDVSDLRRTMEGLNDELDRLVLTLTPQLRAWALRTERWHRQKWQGAVASPTGVDLSFVLGPEDVRETVKAVLARNVSLVRSVNDQTRTRISDIVFRGFTKRTQTREIGKQLTETVEMSRRRANFIAKDQTVKLASALDQERRRQAGLDKWAWVHSGAEHPREDHLERDGNVYSDDDPPEDMPGELPNCGCTSQAILELGDD